MKYYCCMPHHGSMVGMATSIGYGEVRHSLDILDMGVLTKQAQTQYVPICTRFVLECTKDEWVHTRTLPLELDKMCYLSFPTAQSHGPCAECCEPSRNYTFPFRLSCLAGSPVRYPGDHSLLLQLWELCLWNAGQACSHIPLHALDEHLHHLIAWIRYWLQAVETGTFLGVIDGLIDQLNLVHTRFVQVCTWFVLAPDGMYLGMKAITPSYITTYHAIVWYCYKQT